MGSTAIFVWAGYAACTSEFDWERSSTRDCRLLFIKIFLRFWLAPIPRISLHIKPSSHMSGKSQTIIASHAGVFRGARFRDEKRAPLKTPVWEAKTIRDFNFCRPSQILHIYGIIARSWFLKSRLIYPPISSQSMIKFLISRMTNRRLKSSCWKWNYPAIN